MDRINMDRVKMARFRAMRSDSTSLQKSAELSTLNSMPIQSTLNECLSHFGELKTSLAPADRSSLEFQLARLQLWASNLGVYASGATSLDHRLQHDENMRDAILGLLRRLNKLSESLDPSGGHLDEHTDDLGGLLPGLGRPPEESEIASNLEIELQSQLDSGSDSLDDDGDLTEDGKLEPQTTHLAFIRPVKQLVDKLLLIATIIRLPMRYETTHRVPRTSQHLSETQVEENQELASHVRFQLRRARYMLDLLNFELPADFLVERMVNAALLRRRKLRYLSASKPVQKESATTDADADAPANEGPQNDQPLRSLDNHSSLSRIDPSSASQTSNIHYLGQTANLRPSQSAIVRHANLDIPPPPRPLSNHEYICPYCHLLLSVDTTKDENWRWHVLADLEPYVCLLDNCSVPDRLFKDFEECLNHMRWDHSTVWSCNAQGHEHLEFDTAERLRGHIQSSHSQALSEAQIATVLSKSKRPTTAVSDVCPICLNNPSPVSESETRYQSTSDDTEKSNKFYSHISKHMEQLALLSLRPRSSISEENESWIPQTGSMSSFKETGGDDRPAHPPGNEDVEISTENNDPSIPDIGLQKEVFISKQSKHGFYFTSDDVVDIEQPRQDEDPVLRSFIDGQHESYQYAHTTPLVLAKQKQYEQPSENTTEQKDFASESQTTKGTETASAVLGVKGTSSDRPGSVLTAEEIDLSAIKSRALQLSIEMTDTQYQECTDRIEAVADVKPIAVDGIDSIIRAFYRDITKYFKIETSSKNFQVSTTAPPKEDYPSLLPPSFIPLYNVNKYADDDEDATVAAQTIRGKKVDPEASLSSEQQQDPFDPRYEKLVAMMARFTELVPPDDEDNPDVIYIGDGNKRFSIEFTPFSIAESLVSVGKLCQRAAQILGIAASSLTLMYKDTVLEGDDLALRDYGCKQYSLVQVIRSS